MLYGRSSRSSYWSLTHAWPVLDLDETGGGLKKKPARNGSGSHVSGQNSSHTASTPFNLDDEHFQSSEAYGLEGLRPSHAP